MRDGLKMINNNDHPLDYGTGYEYGWQLYDDKKINYIRFYELAVVRTSIRLIHPPNGLTVRVYQEENSNNYIIFFTSKKIHHKEINQINIPGLCLEYQETCTEVGYKILLGNKMNFIEILGDDEDHYLTRLMMVFTDKCNGD